MVEAEIHELQSDGPVMTGLVTVAPNGSAVIHPERMHWITDMDMIDPNEDIADESARISSDNGEAFIRALPYNLRGSYVWARLVEDSDEQSIQQRRAKLTS